MMTLCRAKVKVLEQHSRFFGRPVFPNDDRAFKSAWIHRRTWFAARSRGRCEIDVVNQTQVEKLSRQRAATDARKISEVELSQSTEGLPEMSGPQHRDHPNPRSLRHAVLHRRRTVGHGQQDDRDFGDVEEETPSMSSPLRVATTCTGCLGRRSDSRSSTSSGCQTEKIV